MQPSDAVTRMMSHDSSEPSESSLASYATMPAPMAVPNAAPIVAPLASVVIIYTSMSWTDTSW